MATSIHQHERNVEINGKIYLFKVGENVEKVIYLQQTAILTTALTPDKIVIVSA